MISSTPSLTSAMPLRMSSAALCIEQKSSLVAMHGVGCDWFRSSVKFARTISRSWANAAKSPTPRYWSCATLSIVASAVSKTSTMAASSAVVSLVLPGTALGLGQAAVTALHLASASWACVFTEATLTSKVPKPNTSLMPVARSAGSVSSGSSNTLKAMWIKMVEMAAKNSAIAHQTVQTACTGELKPLTILIAVYPVQTYKCSSCWLEAVFGLSQTA
mmetsp:Transcript_159387/g.387025  ORF Transcript_159387/g.387025 Transcript_159387/m.387025 type:complete len:218 (-) Transcript_159387:2-655(-)